MIKLSILNHGQSLMVETESEVQAACFMTACLLHANGGGYWPKIEPYEHGSLIRYRVVEKWTDGGILLVEAWMTLVNDPHLFKGVKIVMTPEYKREVNRRWANRTDDGPKQYFSQSELV